MLASVYDKVMMLHIASPTDLSLHSVDLHTSVKRNIR